MPPQGGNLDREISGLIELAHQKSTSGRTELFQAIVDLLERRHKDLTDRETALMADILGSILHHVEMEVRKKLAERLADREDTSPELIILLANDEIEVARPVLLLSKLLSDDNLVRIIRHKTIQHQFSIAARKYLSAKVCRELVHMGNDDVVLTLLSNHGARIDNETLNILVEQSREKTALQSPLIERPDLPQEFYSKMYQWVSDDLKDLILKVHNISEQEIRDILARTLDTLNQENGAQALHQRNSSEERLVEKLHKANKLGPAFLMKTLRQGQINLFEISFARMADMPRQVLQSILYDQGADTLALACHAVGIDRSVFLTIFRLTREARNMDTRLEQKEIDKAFEQFVRMDRQQARETLAKVIRTETPPPS
ncbi:DUF2336 domain-containing protein [Luteithermobacter gelatinilyticus]|uniref:DUF2336 domain-containing protein n=1 Tax=Luteithermobacter gelatinilyticus TaxID=2582913 RepID=UPI00143DD388|nr:DUF2336 domain-containing protein [Luteithermobacter gelatinilyticus]